MKTHEEIKEAVAEVLNIRPYCDATIEVKDTKKDGKPAVIVEVYSMYEKPMVPENFDGGLVGFFSAIQLAIGTDNLDLYSEIGYGGCESCDYGSRYGWEFIGWNK